MVLITSRLIIFSAGVLSGAFLMSSIHLFHPPMDQAASTPTAPSLKRELPSSPKERRDFPQVRRESRVSSKSDETPIQHVTPDQLLLPTPIFVMGLPKSGTTSIEAYFKCGFGPTLQNRVSHYDCNPGRYKIACGRRMRNNFYQFRKPLFDGIDRFDVYAELDAQEPRGGMTIPQDTMIQQIHEAYPNATWILNTRDPQKWVQSVDRWVDWRQRFIDNRFTNFPKGKGEKDEEMIQYYNEQSERVRQFVASNPSHTLVEVAIDTEDAGQVMEKAFGITKECWGKRNINDGNNPFASKK